MALFQAFDISASGMTAERFRMDREYCKCKYDKNRRWNSIPKKNCYFCREGSDFFLKVLSECQI